VATDINERVFRHVIHLALIKAGWTNDEIDSMVGLNQP